MFAVAAQVVGALYLYPTHSRENRTGTHAFVLGCVSARTGYGAVIAIRRIPSQKLGERIGASLVDCGAHGHLHSFQVELAGSALVGKNPLKLML
jgi:hypothetical protein